MSKEKFDKFHNIQQQLNKAKNTKNENEKKRASDYYKDRTTVAIKKNTRALLNDLADENRTSSYDMLDEVIESYAKNNHSDRYEKYLNKELKGQES
ncbi:TPA: hypothetical protein ACF9DE_002580 [Staphylococcus aureus]